MCIFDDRNGISVPECIGNVVGPEDSVKKSKKEPAYSPVADDDSLRAPEGCRFKRWKEIIKVKQFSAKIGLAFFHLSAPSAYAKDMMPVGKNRRFGFRVFSGYTSAVPCCAVSISPTVPVTGPFGGMGSLELVGAPDEESMGP